MTMKAVKLDEKAIGIALKYGRTVNIGVIKMSELLSGAPSKVTDKVTQEVTTQPVTISLGELFWNRFDIKQKESEKRIIEGVSGKRMIEAGKVTNGLPTGFRKGSEPDPAIKIGNITKDEEWVAPEGRQGRQPR